VTLPERATWKKSEEMSKVHKKVVSDSAAVFHHTPRAMLRLGECASLRCYQQGKQGSPVRIRRGPTAIIYARGGPRPMQASSHGIARRGSRSRE
jgi:hypothetical protein